MRLIGAPISPFVRRVAVALEFYGYSYEHVKASVVDARDTVGSFNKLVRVPSLELDDGLVLIDSHQILAQLDRMTPQSKRLCLADTGDLRTYGQMIAYLTGAMEKFVATFYERSRRPADKVWPEWAEQCQAQALGGLEAAEALADLADRGDFLFEQRLTHADIAAVLAIEIGRAVASDLVTASQFPRLSSIAARLGDTSIFASSRPTASVS